MSRTRKPFRVFRLSRVIVSIVLGFLVPLAYVVIVIPIDSALHGGRGSRLALPVTWPRFALDLLISQGYDGKNFEIIALVLIVGGNILLYGTLTYSVLTGISMFRTLRTTDFELPPSPSQNEKS